MADRDAAGGVVTLHPALAPYVSAIVGYQVDGLDPGVHIGMPSPSLTMIVSLADPLVVQAPGTHPVSFQTMVSGLHDHPMHIHHDGSQFGIQLDLTPAGARALLGLPAGELAGELVDLSELFGPDGHVLADRTIEQRGWRARADVVQTFLRRHLDRGHDRPRARPEVGRAWDQIRRSAGVAPVRAVAAEVGWSTRHLGERFRHEYGFSPKTAARIARFDRSRRLLAVRHPLAEVAAVCGYADQAHLNRDWRQFAGTSPTRWAAEDQLAFFQDATD